MDCQFKPDVYINIDFERIESGSIRCSIKFQAVKNNQD